MKTTLFWKF